MKFVLDEIKKKNITEYLFKVTAPLFLREPNASRCGNFDQIFITFSFLHFKNPTPARAVILNKYSVTFYLA